MTARLTEDSLRTHGGLTHPLTEDSRLEVEGKGDRKWKGVRAEAFHHVVQLGDASAATAPHRRSQPGHHPDAMMSLTAIEHLDFESEVLCDGVWDGELCQCAAFGVVVALCRGCREGGRSFICRRCWDECQTAGWLCPSCDRSCEPRFIRLVVTFR